MNLTPRRAAQLRLALLTVFVVAAFSAVAVSGGLSSARVRDWADDFGSAAPIAFIATSALLTICFFPGPLLAGAAGLLFGTAVGFPVAMVSATLGACLAFAIARWLAHDAVDELQGPRLRRLRAWIGQRGFVAVLTARFTPGLPYNAVNYAAGLSPMPLPPFVAATVIGAAPRTYAYVSVGGAWGDWTSPAVLGSAALLLVLAAFGLWLARRTGPSAN